MHIAINLKIIGQHSRISLDLLEILVEWEAWINNWTQMLQISESL